MKYRHTRKSNDIYSWIGAALTGLGVATFTIALFRHGPEFPSPVTIVLIALFVVGLVWFLKCIIIPFEWEIVVEEDQIRWGRAGRLAKQQKLRIGQLVKLVYDKSDCKVLGDVGTWKLIPIGDGILMLESDRMALVEYLRHSFPDLKIETT